MSWMSLFVEDANQTQVTEVVFGVTVFKALDFNDQPCPAVTSHSLEPLNAAETFCQS